MRLIGDASKTKIAQIDSEPVVENPEVGEQADQPAITTKRASSVQVNSGFSYNKPLTLLDIENVRNGLLSPEALQDRITQKLLSPATFENGLLALRMAESYSRKATADARNYADTGFRRFEFPKLEWSLAPSDATKILEVLESRHDAEAESFFGYIHKTNLMSFGDSGKEFLASGSSEPTGVLGGSHGEEAVRGGASSFKEEWDEFVEPALDEIQEAIETVQKRNTKAVGKVCPYAQGNHAKGVSFDNVTMKVADGAPDWAKEMFQDAGAGLMRVSGSQTDPMQSDHEKHMIALRFSIPLGGKLDDMDAPRLDLTVNTEEKTHAQTALDHTALTNALANTGLKKVWGIGKYLLGGPLGERKDAIKAASAGADASMETNFADLVMRGRHAQFLGGRYVQFEMKLVRGTGSFEDPAKSPNDPNARINSVSSRVAEGGMQYELYMIEMPEGDPNLVEVESWKGKRTKLGSVTVPAQGVSEKADEYFKDHPHFMKGQNLVNHPVGLGRHRPPAYSASFSMRQQGGGPVG